MATNNEKNNLETQVKEIISQRLKIERTISNIKLEDVSKETGISISSLCRYENGESIPDSINLFKLARFFNVSLDYLYGVSNLKVTLHSEFIDLITSEVNLLTTNLKMITDKDLSLRNAQEISKKMFKEFKAKEHRLALAEQIASSMILAGKDKTLDEEPKEPDDNYSISLVDNPQF